MVDNEDLEQIDTSQKDKVVDVPSITEILEDPVKLIDWQYQTFVNDKQKDIQLAVNSSTAALKEWEKFAGEESYQDFPTIRTGAEVIREQGKVFWSYRLMYEKANKTIEDLKEIINKYYVLKKDVLEGKEEQKEVISQIDEAEEAKGKEFVKKCEELVKGFETDVPKQIINQQLIGNLMRYSQKFIADRFKKFNIFVEQMNVPEKTREEVYMVYLDMHRAFFETYGKYPFIWLKLPEIIKLKNLKSGIKG